MLGKVFGPTLLWLTLVASCIAATASFMFLYRLGDDPIPPLGARFQIAAYLQLIPFIEASILAICLRHRPEILKFSLAAVIVCGAFGGWWLSGFAELRRWENEPVTRRALGNILPDLEGQAASVEALLWPGVVIVVIGGATLIGWAISRAREKPTAV